MLEGPWECASETGIDGILITVDTAILTIGDSSMIDWQTVTLRVYHRTKGGDEEAQHFSAPLYRRFDQPREEDYKTDLRNRHLVIHYNLDLDLTFDAGGKQWTGTWSDRGSRREVVLERPHPSLGSVQNPFVGDWESSLGPNARPSPSSGSLHIRESSDGMLTAWLDRKTSSFNLRSQSRHADLRDGERFKVVADQGKLTLSTTNPLGAIYHYAGTLSTDGKNLVGEWEWQEGARLSAPASFTRMY
jgi:hypothetical protein